MRWNWGKAALEFSNGFCVVIASLWVGATIEADTLARARHMREEILFQEFRAMEARRHMAEVKFHEREVNCLANVIIREAGGEPAEFRRLVALVYIARRDDKDPQWSPKTICELSYQSGQVSGVAKAKLHSLAEWQVNHAIAKEIYRDAWKTHFFPHGWACVRYYKMSDERIARLTLKQRKQLGMLTDRPLRFFRTLRPVATKGSHTFYEDPDRCITPMPTS